MAEKKKRNVKDNDALDTVDAAETKKKKRSRQLAFDSPSEKMIHQILPFVYIVLAILFEVCFVLASLTGEEY